MPIRGEASARLANGKTLQFKVTNGVLARASAKIRLPTRRLLNAAGNDDDPDQGIAMLALVYQALRRHHPAIDEDGVDDLMTTDQEVIVSALTEAMLGAFGDGEAEQADTGANPPQKTTGTGTRSKARGPKQG